MDALRSAQLVFAETPERPEPPANALCRAGTRPARPSGIASQPAARQRPPAATPSPAGARAKRSLDAVDLEPGEEIVFRGHPSWRSQTGLHLRAVALSLIAGVAVGIATRLADHRGQLGWIILAVVVVFAGMAGIGRLRRVQTRYSITDRRLAIETGLLTRELRQTRVERIQNVSSRQSLGERMLGIGTVEFDTAAGSGFDFSFHGVSDPGGIVRTLERTLHERHRGAVTEPFSAL